MQLRESFAFGSIKAMMRVLTMIGDPLGELETTSDYLEYSKKLRSKPVVKSKTGILFSSDFQICSEVLKSNHWRTVPETDSGVSGLLFGSVAQSDAIDPFLDSLLGKDGDEHVRLRKLIQPAFTHRVMQSWKDMAEKVADKLIYDLQKAEGPLEIVSKFANPLPIAMICEILGVPESDREKFIEWGNVLGQLGLDGPRNPEEKKLLEDSSAEITNYIAELLEVRRVTPGEDLLSVLASAEHDGSTLTNREIVATGAFLLVAGFETTVNLLSVGTAALIENRSELEKVAQNHSLIPNMVEETLRFASPVQFTSRSAADDLVLSDGTKVRKGQSIILMIVGANHDPAVFTRPELFDIERENARRNLAFGFGAHHCIGAALARLEAEVAWRKLLEAFPDVSKWNLAEEPVLRGGRTIRGYQSVKINLR
jgi:cytochrome P450